MRKIKGQKGLSLVEVTIMLLVLMLLTSVLAPSIWDFVHDAQWVKVKEDCEAIGISLSRMWRDIGPCLRKVHTNTCTMANRVDVLISQGATIPTDSTAWAGNVNMTTTLDWNTFNAANEDDMEIQLVTNGPAYPTPFQNYPGNYPVGPLFGLGWRGAYLSPPIGPDPWGSAYYVNSGFNATSLGTTNTVQGSAKKWWEYDVICVTGGPNQTIETPFASTTFGTSRTNDDFVFVISGSGR